MKLLVSADRGAPTMRQTEAVLFDMDGVLVDSEPNYFRAYNAALARYGVELTFDYFTRNLVGVRSDECVERICRDFGVAADIASVLAEKEQGYLARARQDPRGNEAVIKLARLLQGRCLVGLASGSARASVEAILAALGLATCFQAVVTGDDVRRGKPDPEIFLLAASRLGVRPAACVVLEDSAPGIEAARRAGMRVVALRSACSSGADSADFVIDAGGFQPADVAARLLNMGQTAREAGRQ